MYQAITNISACELSIDLTNSTCVFPYFMEYTVYVVYNKIKKSLKTTLYAPRLYYGGCSGDNGWIWAFIKYSE